MIFLFGLMSAFSLVTFDIYQPALPEITRFFGTTHAVSQWTMSFYLLIFGVSQLFWGPMLDHYGRRRLFGPSIALSMLATLGCIFSTSIMQLILFRALQGFANCCSSMIANTAPRDIPDEKNRAKAISYISMMVAVSPIFAPVFGAFLLQTYDWQVNFWFMFILLMGLMSLHFGFIPESPFFEKKGHQLTFFDSFKQFSSVIQTPYFKNGCLLVTFGFATMMIIVVNASFLVIDKLGFTPMQFALFFACVGLTIITGNLLGIRLREHISLIHNVFIGAGLMLLSSVIITILYVTIGFSLWVMLPVLFIGLGFNLLIAPAISLVLGEHTALATTASGLMNLSRMIASACIAGIVGMFISEDASFFIFALLGCGIITFLFTLQLKWEVTARRK